MAYVKERNSIFSEPSSCLMVFLLLLQILNGRFFFKYSPFFIDAPVFVYIHGGYWQALDRTISSYCVTPQFKAGHVVAVVGYELAPKG